MVARPQAGEPDVELRTLTPVGELLWYNYFPVCGWSTQQVWHLILLQLCLLYHLFVASSLSLDAEDFFGRFQHFFLAELGLCCCAQAFSRCGKWGLLFVAVHGFLIVVESLVVEHGLQAHRLQ